MKLYDFRHKFCGKSVLKELIVHFIEKKFKKKGSFLCVQKLWVKQQQPHQQQKNIDFILSISMVIFL